MKRYMEPSMEIINIKDEVIRTSLSDDSDESIELDYGAFGGQ